MNLIWFRADLRLADNPALFHALKNQSDALALFVLNPEQHRIHGEAPQKYQFIKAHIKDLSQRLATLGLSSEVHEVPTFADVPALFRQLLHDHPIKQVHFNASYWLNETLRDQQVKVVLKQAGVQCVEHHSNYLLPPGTVRKADASMYHVFTPYKNKYIEVLKQRYQLPLPVPEPLGQAVQAPAELPVDFKLSQWPVGESAVAQQVKSFVQTSNYQAERDFPAIAGTSGLSPYLALGVISAQQCLAHALKQQGEAAFYSTWVSELIWRDFYNDLMYQYPRLAKHQTFKPDAKDHWMEQPVLLQQWQAGRTGFPIVDAGMRQLLAEGWMHNRVRMIVASFLSKLCLIDWRLGEAHFMAHLLDGDLASNNGGWQWSSATGCDAAPYFRIFNPTAQSKKFDAAGSYIKKYVPELQTVDSKEIHEPSEALRNQVGYPTAMIDYKAARAHALDWFKR